MSLRDREIIRRLARQDLLGDISADADTEGDVVIFEPCRVTTPCSVPVVPGNAGAARKAGCEDEYDNEMEARYGEGM